MNFLKNPFKYCLILLCFIQFINVVVVVVEATPTTNGATIQQQPPAIIPRYRLPKTLLPIVYDLKLTLSSISEEILGQVRIELQCLNETSEIILHAHPQFLRITHSTLEHKIGNSTLTIGEPSFNYEIQTINYSLNNLTLEKSNVYYLSIWFITRYSYEQKGFTQSFDNFYGTWMNSLFEPNHARELLPCFDEPNFRSVFKLQIWLQNDFASRGYVALSNTRGKKQSWSEGLSIWTFDPTPPIPTYLFTVTVGKFRSVCQFRKEIDSEICVWRFSQLDGWEATAIEVIKVMALYQKGMMDYLDIDPSARLHLLVIPSKLNGMENFGLLNVKEALWPFDNDTASFQKFCKTLYHEMAHQWFGNLVTMSWWNDIWLSESITSFLSTQRPIVFNPLHDLSEDGLVNDLWTESIPQISYTKGASIMDMLDSVIGSNKMQLVLREYLKTYQFSVASTTDFLKILQNYTKDLPFDAVDFLSSWLYQGSHPMVFIDYDREMRRFILSQTPKMKNKDGRWLIPIWIDCTNNTKKEKLYWIPKNQQLILSLDELTEMNVKAAVAFNRNHATYYEILYRYKK